MNKDKLEEILTPHVMVLADLLKLNRSDFEWDFFSDFKKDFPNYTTMFSVGTFIKPHETINICEPLIILNDELNLPVEAYIQSLAHELRHTWQYYENKQKWNKQFNLKTKDLGWRTTSSTTENMPQKYIELEIEQDAYAFQLAYMWLVLGDKKTLKLDVELFTESIIERANKLHLSYFNAFQRLMKRYNFQ